MNKKVKFSLIALAMAGAIAALAGCGDKKPTVHYATDNRAEAYGFYDADGELISKHKDMYKAIAQCVDDGDEGYYVAKLSGDDKDVKLFTYRATYSGDSADQFFYYENGTSLDRYTPWKNDYHTDLATKSKNDLVVFNEAATGLQTYRQGYETIKVGATGGTVATWCIYPCYDSSVMIDLPPYCGITKAEYQINLKEAKLYPTYEGYATTYAKVGFMIADANNVSSFGIAADVTTGKWYYFNGDIENMTVDTATDGIHGIEYYTDQCILTSTWNEAGGYYTPDSNLTVTAEIVPIQEDEDSEPYYVDRLTVKLDNGKQFVKDYEYSQMTACGTVRFHAGLDIFNESGMPMYDNGAKFENLVLTSGKGYVYEDIANDPTLYGNNTSLNAAGEYDLLDNSNNPDDSEAQFHTVLYNKATITYDISTPGKDVYNFSFRFDQNKPAWSSAILAAKNAIAAIPALDDLTAEDKELVEAAKTAYDYLVSPYQTDFLTAAEVAKFEAADKKMAELTMSGGASALVEAIRGFKEIGFTENDYTTVAALKLDETRILAAYEAYTNLSDEEKETLKTLGVDTKLFALNKALVAINKENSKLGTLLDATIAAYNSEGERDATGAIILNEDGSIKNHEVWDINNPTGTGAALYNFYTAYKACTAAEIAELPANILAVINSEYAQNHIKNTYSYIRIAQIANGWYTKLGWELPHFGAAQDEKGKWYTFSNDMDYDSSNGWFFKTDGKYQLTDELFAKIPEAEIAEVAALNTKEAFPLQNSYALRLNSYAINALIAGNGCFGYTDNADVTYQLMAVVYAVFDYKTDDAYTFDRKPAKTEEGKSYSRLFLCENDLGAVIAAAKTLAASYVDDKTVAGICDLDAFASITPLRAAWDKLNDAQKEALGKVPGTEHVAWAIANYCGEYTKMNSIKEKVAKLEKTSENFEAELKEIIDLFNTTYNSTSYFFRFSDAVAIDDGLWVTGAYTETWTKLQELMGGLYQMNPDDPFHIAPVAAE